jgi:hypothetical protein
LRPSWARPTALPAAAALPRPSDEIRRPSAQIAWSKRPDGQDPKTLAPILSLSHSLLASLDGGWRRPPSPSGRRAAGASPATAPPHGSVVELFPPPLSHSLSRRVSAALEAAEPVHGQRPPAMARRRGSFLFPFSSSFAQRRPQHRRPSLLTGDGQRHALCPQRGPFPFGRGGGKPLHCPWFFFPEPPLDAHGNRAEQTRPETTVFFAGEPEAQTR